MCLTSLTPPPPLKPRELLKELIPELELLGSLMEAVRNEAPDAQYLVRREGDRVKILLSAINRTLNEQD